MSDDRAPAYWESGRLILRASSFGGCIGALSRAALGQTAAPAPEFMLQRYAQGNKAEPIIVAELQRRGHVLTNVGANDQLELELDIAGKVVIRCHPDGIINRSADGEFPMASEALEIKALRPSFKRDFRPYLWQNSIEDASSGLRVLKVYGEKDKEGELVRDVDGNVELDVVEEPTPPFSLLDIKRRALEVYSAVINGRVLECDFKQFPCGYYRDECAACYWTPKDKDTDS